MSHFGLSIRTTLGQLPTDFGLPHSPNERRTARLLQGLLQISQSHTALSRTQQPESVRSVARFERFRTSAVRP